MNLIIPRGFVLFFLKITMNDNVKCKGFILSLFQTIFILIPEFYTREFNLKQIIYTTVQDGIFNIVFQLYILKYC